MNLQGKKILFLTANFFNYEIAVIQRLKELGAEVDFFNERPSDSVFTKGIIRVKSSLYHAKIKTYYQNILKRTRNKDYDFLLLIKGETVPFFFLDEFSKQNSNAVKIFYSYDAAEEYPKFLRLYPYFDRNFTFEPTDAVKYDLHFRPLFFIPDYGKMQPANQPKFDLTFIGSAHTDRYLIGEKINCFCEKLGLKTFFYYYAPGKTAFLLKQIFDKNLKKFDVKKLQFKKLTHKEIAKIYRDSFAVLDVNKPFQNGLTMRTFEALASGKKLITTNNDIVNYPFYSDQNVLVIERDQINIPKAFFEAGFVNISPEIIKMMTLDSWIECLFVKEQDEFWKIKSNRTFDDLQ